MSSITSTRTGGGDVPVGSSSIPSNKSNQKLVNEDYLENQVSSSRNSQELSPSSSSNRVMQRGISTDSSQQKCNLTKSQWLTVLVLVYVNLINYMDRFTLAGKLLIYLIRKKKTCTCMLYAFLTRLPTSFNTILFHFFKQGFWTKSNATSKLLIVKVDCFKQYS